MAVSGFLILFGAVLIVFDMLFMHGRRQSSGRREIFRLGPFSATGSIGFVLVVLGVVVYMLEQRLF